LEYNGNEETGAMKCVKQGLGRFFYGGISMKRFLPVLYILLLAACTMTRGRIPSEYKQTSKGTFPIPYEFLDIPAERKVELRYHNDLGRTICLSPSHWPNQAGKIDGPDGKIVLVLSEKRFPLIDFNTGYCPGCAQGVAPGETIIGFISYSDFNLPEELVNEGKKLEFTTYGYFCKKRK
jgi:hypothetical protein